MSISGVWPTGSYSVRSSGGVSARWFSAWWFSACFSALVHAEPRDTMLFRPLDTTIQVPVASLYPDE